MPTTEAQLKQQLRDNTLSRVYVLYGEESYLTTHYVRTLAEKAVDSGDFADFNAVYAQYFPTCPARSCVAVKTLPKNVLCEIEAIAVLEK